MQTPLCGIPGQHRALDRRRAAPAREQRGMDIDTAQTRRLQNRGWQQQTIGHHDHQIGVERTQLGDRIGILFQALGLEDRNAAGLRQQLDRAHLELLSAPGGAIRLGVDRNRLQTGIDERGKTRHRELGRSGENDFE